MTPPVSRGRERIGGLVLALVGAGLLLFEWSVAATRVTFSVIGAFMGPAALVLGVALLLVPGYRTERLLRGETIDEDTPLLTPRWKGILALALALGLLNWWLLRNGLAPSLF